MSYESQILAMMTSHRFVRALGKGDDAAALAAVARLHELAVPAVLYEAGDVLEQLHASAVVMQVSDGFDDFAVRHPGTREGLECWRERAEEAAARQREIPLPPLEIQGRHRWMLETLAEGDKPVRDFQLAADMGMHARVARIWIGELVRSGLADPGILFRDGRVAISPLGRAAIGAPEVAVPAP